MAEISVVIPVYNTEAYLPACMESVLSQRFQDLEVILIDDGSTDGSGALCERYAGMDPRVRVLHQENAGQSAARNRGVKAARAEWVCFIDSDDTVNPWLLSSFYAAVSETGAGAAVCGRVQGKEPPPGFDAQKAIRRSVLRVDEDSLLELFRKNDTVYWTLFPCLLKKGIYERYPLAEGRVMEDNAVTCKWLTAAGKVARIEEALYFYRDNPGGTMRAPFSEKKLDYLWALEEQLAFFEERGYLRLYAAVEKHYLESAVWFSGRIRRELGEPALARRLLRRANKLRRRWPVTSVVDQPLKRKLFKARHPFLHRIGKSVSARLKHAPGTKK